MNGFRFYADLPGTEKDEDYTPGVTARKPKKVFPLHTTIKQLKAAAESGRRCNVIALLLGPEHRCHDHSQECLSATFGHADSDTSLGSISREYLDKCRRIPESLARLLHPRLFARLDADEG